MILAEEHRGKVFCGNVEKDEAWFIYVNSYTGRLLQTRMTKKTNVSNTNYSKKELAKVNNYVKRWVAGLEVKPDCDSCGIKFYCYTNKFGLGGELDETN